MGHVLAIPEAEVVEARELYLARYARGFLGERRGHRQRTQQEDGRNPGHETQKRRNQTLSFSDSVTKDRRRCHDPPTWEESRSPRDPRVGETKNKVPPVVLLYGFGTTSAPASDKRSSPA